MALAVVWITTSIIRALGAQPGVASVNSTSAGEVKQVLLTNAWQVLNLSQEKAAANLPVRVSGRVTFYDHGRVLLQQVQTVRSNSADYSRPAGRVLFVQDTTAGVFVYYAGDRLPVEPGQYVEVQGVATPGRYSPIIRAERIDTAEGKVATVPLPSELSQITSGGLHAQWVKVKGVIRSRKVVDSRLRLELADPQNRVTVWIRNFQGQEDLLLAGSRVQVIGVVGESLSELGQVDGFQLFVNSSTDVRVLEPGSADPFAAPLSKVEEFKKYPVRKATNDMARVQGIVTLSMPGRPLFIQDSSGGLEVRTSLPLNDLKPGTAIEAAGYVGPVLEPPRLEDAEVRVLQTNAPPQPVRLWPDDLFGGQYQNQLVRIEANLLAFGNTPTRGLALALQHRGRFLTALLDADQAQEAWAALEPGSRLQITGVCQVDAGADGGPAVSLLLRSPLDVLLLNPPKRGPATRTPAYAATAVAATLALALAVWFILRQRGQALAAKRSLAALRSEMRQSDQQLRRSMEERERIGRDLHDDIIQSIYAVGLCLEDSRRVVREAPDRAEARLATGINMLNATIRSVRGFIAGLEPKVLNGREFKTALKSLALISGEGPTQFHFDVDPAAANSLTSAHATQLLHIAKEAMSNSVQHAHASSITVSLRQVGSGVALEIRDDGVGFDPRKVDGPGQGLRNITARGRDIGAEVQIRSATGQGCRILITVAQRTSKAHDGNQDHSSAHRR